MHSILIANSKGGSGKTTLTTNLAGALARAGQQVVLYSVVQTWGTAPRAPGAMLALREDGVTRYEVPVTVGMETDYFVEISGPEVQPGLVVLNDPEGKNVANSSMPAGPFGG